MTTRPRFFVLLFLRGATSGLHDALCYVGREVQHALDRTGEARNAEVRAEMAEIARRAATATATATTPSKDVN